MDDELWERSGLGPATARRRGPSERRRRMDARAHIGRLLRGWREAHDLSRKLAHARLELSGSVGRMHQFEHGEIPWTRSETQAVAAALGMDVAHLVQEALNAADPAERGRRAEFISWAVALPAPEWQAIRYEVELERDRSEGRPPSDPHEPRQTGSPEAAPQPGAPIGVSRDKLTEFGQSGVFPRA